MKNYKLLALLGLSLAASLGTASAAGLLGQRYVAAEWATIDHQDKDLKSAYGAGVTFNAPVHKSVDVSVGFSQLRLVQGGIVATGTDIAVGAVYHEAFENTDDKLKLFVGGQVGNEWANAKGYGQKFDEKSWNWLVNTGLEYEVVQDLSVSVGVGYTRSPEFAEEGDTIYTARANYWVSKHIGATASFSLNEESDRLTTVGLGFRF